jgi:hypothetical protein
MGNEEPSGRKEFRFQPVSADEREGTSAEKQLRQEQRWHSVREVTCYLLIGIALIICPQGISIVLSPFLLLAAFLLWPRTKHEK